MLQKYLYDIAVREKPGVFPGLLRVFLSLLSCLYGLSVRLVWLYWRIRTPYRSKLKVISVGNITVGGSGKTPLVEYIAKQLIAKGKTVAILSRGYGRPNSRGLSNQDDYAFLGDEPFMLSKKLPQAKILVNPDRIHSLKEAQEKFKTQVAILDDGMQQWRIKKDLEIVVIDAAQDIQKAKLLPRGLLREPLSALKQADIFLVNKQTTDVSCTQLRGFLNRINKKALYFEAVYQKEKSTLDLIKGKHVFAFCGIAGPERFIDSLKEAGAKLLKERLFPDHYPYKPDDIKEILEEAEDLGAEVIITTEKDYARLQGKEFSFLKEYKFPIRVLEISLKIINDEEKFNSRLASCVSV